MLDLINGQTTVITPQGSPLPNLISASKPAPSFVANISLFPASPSLHSLSRARNIRKSKPDARPRYVTVSAEAANKHHIPHLRHAFESLTFKSWQSWRVVELAGRYISHCWESNSDEFAHRLSCCVMQCSTATGCICLLSSRCKLEDKMDGGLREFLWMGGG